MKKQLPKRFTMEEWQDFMRTRWAIEPENVMIPAPRPVGLPILTRPISRREFAEMPCGETVH